MIRGYSSLVRSAVISAPQGRYEDNPLQFIPLVSLSNHLKCTIESDSSWIALEGRNLNRPVSLKVRSRVTQWCPRRDRIGTAGQANTTVGLVLARGREIPCSTKVELFVENARQGKETVHLVGNRTSWWDDRASGHRLWLWGWTWLLSLSATHLNKDNDHGCSDRKLIKCLMDSADDLSSHWLVHTTSTWDYGVAPLCCGLVRGLFRHLQYHGLRRV